jgi:opacity protein-like surface antigen
MKKLILSTALLLAANSYATTQDSFYITGAVGASKVSKYKIDDLKHKPKNAFIADVGVGYNITDSTRADVVLTRQFDSKSKASDSVDLSDSIDGIPDNTMANLQMKSAISANALMVRLHQDVFDYGVGKVFLTGGVGVARVKQKLDHSISAPSLGLNPTFNSVKQKSKNNFAFNVAVGSSFEVQENVMLDLSLGYTDFGKVKSKKVKQEQLASNEVARDLLAELHGDDDILFKGKNLRAFSVKAGVRFNL